MTGLGSTIAQLERKTSEQNAAELLQSGLRDIEAHGGELALQEDAVLTALMAKWAPLRNVHVTDSQYQTVSGALKQIVEEMKYDDAGSCVVAAGLAEVWSQIMSRHTSDEGLAKRGANSLKLATMVHLTSGNPTDDTVTRVQEFLLQLPDDAQVFSADGDGGEEVCKEVRGITRHACFSSVGPSGIGYRGGLPCRVVPHQARDTVKKWLAKACTNRVAKAKEEFEKAIEALALRQGGTKNGTLWHAGITQTWASVVNAAALHFTDEDAPITHVLDKLCADATKKQSTYEQESRAALRL